jgi:adenylate cyclase
LVELSWIELWTSLDDSIAHLSDALLAGQTAVMLDGNDALCHRALAFAHMARKSFDLAAHHLGIATKLNPSDAETLAERATLEVFTGRPQEALNLIDLATKLNPMPSNRYWEIQGVALYQLRRYTEAASVFERATVRLPHAARYLAACYAQMGRLTEATALVAESLRKQPHFTLGVWATAEPYQSQADLDHMREGMRKAGLPE